MGEMIAAKATATLMQIDSVDNSKIKHPFLLLSSYILPRNEGANKFGGESMTKRNTRIPIPDPPDKIPMPRKEVERFSELNEEYEECLWRESIQHERRMSIIALVASTLALVVNIVLRVLKMML